MPHNAMHIRSSLAPAPAPSRCSIRFCRNTGRGCGQNRDKRLHETVQCCASDADVISLIGPRRNNQYDYATLRARAFRCTVHHSRPRAQAPLYNSRARKRKTEPGYTVLFTVNQRGAGIISVRDELWPPTCSCIAGYHIDCRPLAIALPRAPAPLCISLLSLTFRPPFASSVRPFPHHLRPSPFVALSDTGWGQNQSNDWTSYLDFASATVWRP